MCYSWYYRKLYNYTACARLESYCKVNGETLSNFSVIYNYMVTHMLRLHMQLYLNIHNYISISLYNKILYNFIQKPYIHIHRYINYAKSNYPDCTVIPKTPCKYVFIYFQTRRVLLKYDEHS